MMRIRLPWNKLFFLAFFAWLTWLAQDHIFFWDTVQFAGKHGLWFFEQHFRYLLLPPEIDSGHPPVFGWYLALIWLIFGKSLAASHWAMFPFIAGIIWQLFRLAKLLLHRIPAYWLPVVVLADPLFLGQSVLVSPDIILLFFFLWALNGLLYRQPYAKALAYLGLAMISMRGMMVVAAFGIYELWSYWPLLRRSIRWQNFEWITAYLPAGLFSLLFFVVHYYQYGWIGYHSDSPWAPGFERVDLPGFLHNLAVLGWRWLDFGRIFVWLVVLFLFVNKLLPFRQTTPTSTPQPATPQPVTPQPATRNPSTRNPQPATRNPQPATRNPQPATRNPQPATRNPQPVNLLLILTLLLSISFLSYRGLQAHRYLWPAFLLFHLFCLILVDQLAQKKLQKILLSGLLIGLLSGNLLIYPAGIAQGWDATLAHWPYYSLRQQMLDYLKVADIPLNEVGTAFPDIGPLKFRDLSADTLGFKEKDLRSDQWILYSNIMNDFTDAERQELQQYWIEEKRFESRGIEMLLYKKTF